MLGTHTSLLMAFGPAQQASVGERGSALGYREGVDLDVSVLSENFVCTVHAVRSFREQGVKTGVRFICFSSI